MAITAQRRLNPQERRRFGKEHLAQAVPDLTQIQTSSYAEFLQEGVDSDHRKDVGLESVLKEIFPIESFTGQFLAPLIDGA